MIYKLVSSWGPKKIMLIPGTHTNTHLYSLIPLEALNFYSSSLPWSSVCMYRFIFFSVTIWRGFFRTQKCLLLTWMQESPPWHLLKLAVFRDCASGSPPHTVLPNYREGINLQFYLLDLCRCGQICQAWINSFFLCLGSLYPCQSGWYLFTGRGKLIFIRWKWLVHL